MIEDVRVFDYEQLMSDLEAGKTEACGGGPTVAVMAALRGLGVVKMEILHHCNSGDITGDNSGVVGYLSAVAYE
jgi:AmmeMemoRadiSam system protein B